AADNDAAVGGNTANRQNRLAQRILAGPVQTRGGFVDDHCTGSILIVVAIEISSGTQRNSHDLEVVRTDHAIPEGDTAILTGRPALDRETVSRIGSAERQIAHDGCGLHSVFAS